MRKTIKSLYEGVGFSYLVTVAKEKDTSQRKLAKAIAQGFLSAGIHFAPASMSGYNACSFSTPGCRASCLTFAGQGGIGLDENNINFVQKARIARTKLFFEQRGRFWEIFHYEMERFLNYARKRNLTPTFRPNITSDIPWERIPVGYETRDNMFQAYPLLQFMDYTAFPLHTRKSIPDNYHLTFSLKETNLDQALFELQSGNANVAVPFFVNRTKPLPEVWNGFPVLDGDKHDLRFLDKPGHVVGLRVKGHLARRDTTGFIVDPNQTTEPNLLIGSSKLSNR